MKNKFIEVNPDIKKESGNILKLYLEEINRRNIPMFKIAKGMYQFGMGNKLVTLPGMSDLKSAILTKNKNLTHNILRGCGIKVPKQIIIEKGKPIPKSSKELKFPFVVKPFDKSLSMGVTLGIRNKKQLDDALKYAYKYSNKVVIEEFIENALDYRINFFQNQYLGALVSIPQYIEGDGKKTIKQLLLALDSWRKKKYDLKPREDHWIYHMALSQHGLKLSSVLKNHRKIKIYSGSGLYKNISEKIHPENIELCRIASDILGLYISGVDFMSPDASVPYYKNGGKINEINGFPDLGIYTKTPIGEKVNVAKKAIKILFPSDKSAWIPIKYKGRLVNDFGELKKIINIKPKEIFLADEKKKIKNTKLPLLAFLINHNIRKINI